MKHLFRQLRTRTAERTLRSASFCEECRAVSTAVDRHERRLDLSHQASSGTGLFRY